MRPEQLRDAAAGSGDEDVPAAVFTNAVICPLSNFNGTSTGGVASSKTASTSPDTPMPRKNTRSASTGSIARIRIWSVPSAAPRSNSAQVAPPSTLRATVGTSWPPWATARSIDLESPAAISTPVIRSPASAAKMGAPKVAPPSCDATTR